jgi:16S rRNA (adenine(1408)-N(1))-methyltransferase
MVAMLRQPVTSTVTRSLVAPIDLREWASRFDRVHVDLGTGDGAYAMAHARKDPRLAMIGADTCLDHLAGSPRRRPGNVRFVALDALDWPVGLLPVANTVTINFPYGSLLRGLIHSDPALVARLDALLGPGSRLEVRVNASAMLATGLDPANGPAGIARALRWIEGLRVSGRTMPQGELRAFPSSWSKRLGYGKETTAHLITAVR